MLQANSVAACFVNKFENLYALNARTREVYAIGQSTTMFYNCTISGTASMSEVILIEAPASLGPGAAQDTFTLDYCRVGKNQAGYPLFCV